MSEDVNDVYMSIKYDSIKITRLHILRIMTITLLIMNNTILIKYSYMDTPKYFFCSSPIFGIRSALRFRRNNLVLSVRLSK